jgi:quercetin dioxygenase-like cupin family protein
MKTLKLISMAMLIAGGISMSHEAQAQLPGTRRVELHRHDLSIPGREVIQLRVDFDPGASFPRHRHPGEEIIYVIEGSIEYAVEGAPTKTYEAGEVLTVSAGVIHSAKNVGSGNAAELGTYVVEKGKPLVELVK